MRPINPLLHRLHLLIGLGVGLALTPLFAAGADEPILFNTAFEGASLGKVEAIGPTEYRLHVAGQHDERGRNRQATWYYFRMDRVAGRSLTLTLTDWVGEYNDRPGAVPMGPKLRPWLSEDGKTWRPLEQMTWDETRKEATVTFQPSSPSIWLAHLEPYTLSRMDGVLAALGHSPHARLEQIGRSVGGRPLWLVTITDFDQPDTGKKTVWLQARQHAWETGTSFVMEGALRFAASDDPVARRLRATTIFKFTPLVDPDGVATGKVRFNANGYDLNRHWQDVDLRDPAQLRAMPEIWAVKKAIRDHGATGARIALLVNLHNTRSEFMDTAVDREPERAPLDRLFARLVANSHFDPYRPMATLPGGSTMLALWWEMNVPVALMELRTEPGRKSVTLPTSAERIEFGEQLIAAMAEAAW